MAQFFVDRRVGKLSNVRRTAVGGLLVDATLAKVGVMDYYATERHSNGRTEMKTVRRYNPPTVLAAVAADVATAPVTNGHPDKFVDVQNYKDLAKGHVVGTPTFEDGHIKATLAINDAELIRLIELGGAREVSMGYMAEHDEKPGVSENGEAYDEARVKIEWNHIAVVPAGRAGKTVRLMLDSADIPAEVEDNVTIMINGVAVQVDAAQAEFDRYDAGLQAALVQLRADVARLEGERDAATQLIAETRALLVAAQSDEAIDAAVQKRLDAKAAKDAADAKLAAVKAAFPTISLDGKSQDYIDALHDAIPAKTVDAKDPEGLNLITAPSLVTKDANKDAPKKKPVSSSDAYAEMRAADKDAWKAPASPES